MQARVLYEYEAHDDDQLSIKPGEIIQIIDDADELNGWALAQKDDKEGYVPAEYVQFLDNNNNDINDNLTHQPYNVSSDWQPSGFKTYYENVLSQEHHLPFFFKLTKALRDVLIPCPCSRFGYVMSRSDLRRGAILSLIISLTVSLVDCFSIISPTLPFGTSDNGASIGQIIVCIANVLFRIIMTLIFINRYPRQNLNLMTFPFLNVISSLTYSIRVYETLEMGDNKEYDGYRYYRSWMWASLLNLPFEIAALILVIVQGPGLIAVSVLVLVWNLLNVGRCFLAAWANMESGNDIHPDFEQTIKGDKL